MITLASFVVAGRLISMIPWIFLGSVLIPSLVITRRSIPGKVGFWVGLRIVSYMPTHTKFTNAISKTQLLGPKKGVLTPKIPRKSPFFVFGVF